MKTKTLVFYRNLRDQFASGKPMWVTETADAACGGNPWASTFLDTFRYLDQLGRLAKQGVQVVMHNTLAASDYGLINFIQKVTELCRGKAYFTTPQTLGQYLLMDYMNRKTRTVH